MIENGIDLLIPKELPYLIAIKQIKRKLQLTGWTTVNRLVYAAKK